MADNIKAAVTLFLITLVSGLLLGGVYVLTKEPIDRANNAALYAAYEALVPGGEDYETQEELAAQVNEELSDGRYGSVTINSIVKPVDAEGKALGYIVDVTSHEGYGGDIEITVGYTDQDGALTSTGISFLSISETAGLGMNAQNPEFKDQFIGKSTGELTVTKSGNPGDTEINAMSGATITSTAVTNAVDAANYAVSAAAGQ